MTSFTKRFAPVLLATLLGACAGPGFAPLAVEEATGFAEKPGWVAQKFAVAAANPLASAAGYQVLKAGGSAVDAAIAVQMVLTLVEPQSSGIGGGAFLLHFNGKEVEAFDGRETAPSSANEQLFMGSDGKPMPFMDAVVGGRAVGVPGAVAMLEMAHKRHGKLPWARLFEPAVQLAEQGFKVSPRLNGLLKTEAHLKRDPVAAAYFYQADGTPHAIGYVLRNPALAATLRQIATQGAQAFKSGPLAEAIVAKVRNHPSNPGGLSLADLAAYQPVRRAPVCHDYAPKTAESSATTAPRAFKICGFPPPSSGAIAVGQILGLLNASGAGDLPLNDGLPSADWLHLYLEASRLAFADRAQYVADPDFVAPPATGWMSLLDPAYLAERAKLIARGPGAQSMKLALPGNPGNAGGAKTSFAPMPDQPEYGTSHISIVDAAGNALAMTTTIEAAFGARQMVGAGAAQPNLVGGFLLNNELTDFSFAPADSAGRPIANRVQPGKRPRSSMSPTLVFDKNTGELLMSAGSPGGAFIIHFTAKTLYAVLNWGLLPQQAINLPNFGSLNGPAALEENRFPPATVDALRARGHEPREASLTSGLQAITRGQAHGTPVWFGGADPRREGIVMGD